ncbi:protein ACTIVITY OF BC1 COMPLEX KINASE 8, chloroplastic isoform X1 [Syzygium oleosum]|uniref:protein ACTIVITY OF BC1 COMPLEX KINASE 8, chloroplastic isoform X1 n=1 Tax=Syzygium oleosum TaxID=219896 RepID=UPI0024B8EAF9|nr:protein ACTIVITY OF BC1 COMPLEX KINASE 8, chloroplastic isoform X1 [Syzygium oleosum]XP_030463253.2 protein ACTIVITY OF BC1 COMPLEX KINASE 8, chloroplastic isoform X1 [Syzygium oleosum]
MAASLLFPDLAFLSAPRAAAPTRRLSSLSPRALAGTVASFSSSRRRRSGSGSRRAAGIGVRARVVKEEEGVLVENLNGYPSNGNGAASTSSGGGGGGGDASYSNGSAGYHADERGRSAEDNGSLVKYVEGNGSAAAGASASRLLKEVEVVEATEEGRKRRIEEIGKEDAWFKQSGPQVEVSVAPGGRWSRFKTYSTIQRTLEIWGFVLTFIFRVWLSNQKFSYRGGMTEQKKVLRRKVLAKWLKENILRLGPTFIKIGQQFSTRVDILPQEYVDQLSELQDQVPPFPSETALSIVQEELGAPLENIFDSFDYEPIAAASLGQVHRARLKGQEVVVKVQRPGLKDLFDVDLKNLRVISEYLQKIDPKSDGAKRDWVAIYDECASVLYQEIDYTKEAANAELFASNFKDMDYVKVPSIFWEYTTPQVLTMEYVPGIKINKIQALDQLGVDRKRLGRYAVESYLEQILSHGFFHADPHPGNIAVDDVNGGRLIFYDFGMMGSISSNIREGLLETFYGVYEKDPDKVLQAMIQMGVLVPTGDMTAVRRTAQFFLNSFEERLAAQRREAEMATTELGFKKPLSKEEMIEKKKQRLAAIGEDLLSIAADQPFRFPATFTFVVRAFSVLDGIGKGLDPRFDITEIAKPYALELLKFREAGVEVILKDFRKRWERQSRAFYNLFRQADRVEKLAEIIQRLEQGDLKLRVRTLESERAFQRVAAVQKTVGNAVAAGSLMNLATILYLNSIRAPALAASVLCAFFGFQVLFGLIKVKKLDQRERLITGTA